MDIPDDMKLPPDWTLIKEPHSNLLVAAIFKDIRTDTIKSALETIINRIPGTLAQWSCADKATNEISKYQLAIVKLTRKILNVLSGHNICGLLSSVLTETQQIKLSAVSPMIDSVHQYINDENCEHKQKALQFIAPHISFASLKNTGYNERHRASYKNSRKYYKDNGGLSFKIKKRTGRPSKIKNPRFRRIVLNHCASNADQSHERLLKRKSKKLGVNVYAKRLTVRYNNT